MLKRLSIFFLEKVTETVAFQQGFCKPVGTQVSQAQTFQQIVNSACSTKRSDDLKFAPIGIHGHNLDSTTISDNSDAFV